MMLEVWEDISGAEGKYQVSTLGRVRSLDRLTKSGKNNISNKKGKILKPRYKRKYVEFVYYDNNNDRVASYIHRLVAEAFLDKVEGKDQVNHIDGNPLNNNLSNLEWVTPEENRNHARGMGLLKSVKKKLTKCQVLDIYNKSHNGYTIKQLAETYDIGERHVIRIKHGHRWNSITNHNKE